VTAATSRRGAAARIPRRYEMFGFVTGASSGLGEAFACRLPADGHGESAGPVTVVAGPLTGDIRG
jgi:hypothetical protein